MQVHGPTWLGGALAIVTLTVCGCGVVTQAAQTPRIVTAAGNGGPDPLRYSWGGCYYRLGTKIPATDLGEKLGSPVSYAMDSVGYDVYMARIPGERHLDRLAFVVGGSAHEGIRAGQLYNPGDAISQAARALENYVSEATFPTRHGTMEGRVAVGGSTPLRIIPVTLQTRIQTLPPYCSDTFRVTFVERWKAKVFRSAYRSALTLVHYWVFRVTPVFAQFLSQGGKSPPQVEHQT